MYHALDPFVELLSNYLLAWLRSRQASSQDDRLAPAASNPGVEKWIRRVIVAIFLMLAATALLVIVIFAFTWWGR